MKADERKVARDLYMSVYKTRKLSSEDSLSVCLIIVEKLIETIPPRIFKSGFIGEEPNPQYSFWMDVKYELETMER